MLLFFTDWKFDAKEIEQQEGKPDKTIQMILVLPANFLFRCMYITQLSAAFPRKIVQFNSMVIATVRGLFDHISKGKCRVILML